MPASNAEAEGVGGGGMTGMGRPPPSGAPEGMPEGGVAEVQSGGNAMISRTCRMVSNAKLALAAGYVVVEPGARGRTLTDSEGVYHASHAIFTVGAWCPITDLEHADMVYEWNWGTNPPDSGELVVQEASSELAGAFSAYQASLNLESDSFGPLTADTFGDYLVATYFQPGADRYLAALSEADLQEYLAANPFISYENGTASFTWTDFKAHAGSRKKSLPAFDAFDLSSGENNLFGLGITEARHIPYSLHFSTDDETAELDQDIPLKLQQMNPMPFLFGGDQARAKNW